MGGSVHARYIADFGLGRLTPRRPKIRPYLNAETLTPHYESCKAAELFMHFRLETLPLNAFHSHTRQRESAEARRIRERCPSCLSHAETPTHFLLECPAYSAARSLPQFAHCFAEAQAHPTQAPWRSLLDMPEMAHFVFKAWTRRRAALTGREANGGNSMALTPVPAADITGAH
jgi:hypothetical protein